MYLWKLALRPWRLAPLSQIFSALAVGFLLLLVGILFWMQRGLRPLLYRLQGEQVVTAYLESQVSEKGAEGLVRQIRTLVEETPGSEVNLVTAPQFISLLRSKYPDLGRQLEDLGKEMDFIVPRYISVKGVFRHSVLDQIKKLPGIEFAESSKDRYRAVVGAFSALRTLSRIFMSGICLALLTGLIQLARLNSYMQQDALSLLHFWGGSRRTLLVPSLVSGAIVGILGGSLAFGSWMTAGVWITRQIRELSPFFTGLAETNSQLGFFLFILGGSVGLAAGLFGSLTTRSQSLAPHDLVPR